MSDTKKLRFDVASVREDRGSDAPSSNFPLNPGPQFGDTGGVLRGHNMLLLQYVVFAYKPNSWQIQGIRQGMPEWSRSAHYDIEAKAAAPATKDEMRAMMRSLLEERFGMLVHTEMRESNVFVLRMMGRGKLGPRIRVHPLDDPECKRTPMAETAMNGYPHQCGTGARIAPSGPGLDAVAGQNVSMDHMILGFTDASAGVDRPVVNGTGLEGTYDFSREWAVGTSDPSAPQRDAGPGFFDAVKEHLGMKLVPDRALVEFIVVDKVERPTAN